MTTAFTDERLVASAVDAGVFGYVAKPFRAADLLPAIRTAAARHADPKRPRGAQPSRRRSKGRTRRAEVIAVAARIFRERGYAAMWWWMRQAGWSTRRRSWSVATSWSAGRLRFRVSGCGRLRIAGS
jgi:DNA-binding response OmpR family regulator